MKNGGKGGGTEELRARKLGLITAERNVVYPCRFRVNKKTKLN